jgi:CRISPR system Cascade subunit CasE
MFLSLLSVNVGDNPDRPQPGQKWLGDIYRVHQRLWMAFSDDRRRTEDPFFLGPWNGPDLPEPKPKRHEAGFLFRIERDGVPRILVQSIQRPNWEYAFQNAPYLLVEKARVREFEPAPKRDQIYRFRLLANVVHRKNEDYPQEKKRKNRPELRVRRRTERPVHLASIPDPLLIDPTEQNRMISARWGPWREWMKKIGDKNGFQVIDQPQSPLFMETVYTCVHRPRKLQENASLDKRYNGGLFEGLLVCTDEDRMREVILNGIGSAKAFGFGLLSLAPAD